MNEPNRPGAGSSTDAASAAGKDRRVPSEGLRTLAVRYGPTVLVCGMLPLVVIGVSAATGLLDLLPNQARAVSTWVAYPALAAFAVGIVSQWLPRPQPPEPSPIGSPVQGRWRAINSPATKVPSHGTHLYGQSYAVDLVHEPRPDSRPQFGGRHPMRDPREYPSFGAPVVSPVDGRVVAGRDRARDHRCRSNLLGYLYMVLEGLIISLRGPAGLLGNHVIIASADGNYVALAHLQHGSLEVVAGDRVVAGERLARVGNSGNSSEPHVHLQLMDRAHASRALGHPCTLNDIVVSDALEPPTETPPAPAMPVNHEVFHARLSVR